MCGIVGLFIKNPQLESQLGALVAPMLSEMTERGPDSAGMAVYRDPNESGCKVTVLAQEVNFDWEKFEESVHSNFSVIKFYLNQNHAVLSLEASLNEVEDWLQLNWKQLSVTSAGSNIEIFKGKGNP
ncbi:MAG: amidophosphoribosyltransferase, partial [Candidatus Pseudothioglobus sp.]